MYAISNHHIKMDPFFATDIYFIDSYALDFCSLVRHKFPFSFRKMKTLPRRRRRCRKCVVLIRCLLHSSNYTLHILCMCVRVNMYLCVRAYGGCKFGGENKFLPSRLRILLHMYLDVWLSMGESIYVCVRLYVYKIVFLSLKYIHTHTHRAKDSGLGGVTRFSS